MYIEISIQIIVLPTIFLKDLFLILAQVNRIVTSYSSLQQLQKTPHFLSSFNISEFSLC